MRNYPEQIIHLGIYGKTAAKTLKLFLAELRSIDSWRETNPLQKGRHFTGNCTNVLVDNTGEVQLSVNKSYIEGAWSAGYSNVRAHSSYKNNYDVAYIKNWFASELMKLVQEKDDNCKFQIHSTSKSSLFSRAWEVKATAAALLDKDVKSLFGKKAYNAVVGTISDPVKTEIAGVIVEETNRIRREFSALRLERRANLKLMIRDLQMSYRHEIVELAKQERRKISQMKKDILS